MQEKLQLKNEKEAKINNSLLQAEEALDLHALNEAIHEALEMGVNN